VFVALLNGSRESLAEYVVYQREIDEAAARVNARHATTTWEPVVVDTRDDYPQTVAAFQRYDVLLVNSLKDGLNLVAKEGPVLNRRDGVLLLSPETGAFDELGDHALRAHPYDVEDLAETIHCALTMTPDERVARAAGLRGAATRRTPETWLRALVSEAR
jgi:trehalose 6-phosphate synthase